MYTPSDREWRIAEMIAAAYANDSPYPFFSSNLDNYYKKLAKFSWGIAIPLVKALEQERPTEEPK